MTGTASPATAGVSPVVHLAPPVVLVDRELFRFDRVWAAP